MLNPTKENRLLELCTFFKESDTSFGVFYPKHYILATFPSFGLAEQANFALRKAGFGEDETLAVTGGEALEFFRKFHDEAGLWGSLMNEVSRFFDTEAVLVDQDVQHAKEGAGFLAVHSLNERASQRIREVVSPFAPIAMHWYLPAAVQSLI
jgi:hypothetical protein